MIETWLAIRDHEPDEYGPIFKVWDYWCERISLNKNVFAVFDLSQFDCLTGYALIFSSSLLDCDYFPGKLERIKKEDIIKFIGRNIFSLKNSFFIGQNIVVTKGKHKGVIGQYKGREKGVAMIETNKGKILKVSAIDLERRRKKKYDLEYIYGL